MNMEHEVREDKDCSRCHNLQSQVNNLEDIIKQCSHCSQHRNKENITTKLEDLQEKNSPAPLLAENIQEISEISVPENERTIEKIPSIPLSDKDINITMEHRDKIPNPEDTLVARGCQRKAKCPTMGVGEPSVAHGNSAKLKEATTDIKENTAKLKETAQSLKENYVLIDSKDTNFDKLPSGLAVLTTATSGEIPSKCEHYDQKTSLEVGQENNRQLNNEENDERITDENLDHGTSTIDKTHLPQGDTWTKLKQEDQIHMVDNTKIASPKSRKHHKHDSKNSSNINNLSSKDAGDTSPKHTDKNTSDQTLRVEERTPEKPPSSDLQSHPVTQPTDQMYPGMASLKEDAKDEFGASFITDIVNKLQHLSKQCQLLMETKAIMESDMIKMQKQHQTEMQENIKTLKNQRQENEALKMNQKAVYGQTLMDPQLLTSIQSTISDNEYVHIVKAQHAKPTKDNDDSLLSSLKQMDDKDRMIEKYKTHMQKLAAANQSWYEQHQQTQAEYNEKLAKLQQQLADRRDKDEAYKVQISSLQEQLQNLEREIQHETEQRAAFEKMYKTMRERLEKEVLPYKERAEKAEREATMYREQLVKTMDDKDQLHIENRKLQTEAWVKQQAGISPAEGSMEEKLRTQIDVLKHQVVTHTAATWKDDFERERKDRTRAQAETDRQKKKNEGIHIELQNAEYRIEGLTRDLQNLRARNIELERKRHSSSPPPLYVASGSSRPGLLEYPSNHPDRWNCRKCTYSNIPERGSCELCGASRESRRTNQGHYTAPQRPSDITFPHYKLSRDVSPDHNYTRR